MKKLISAILCAALLCSFGAIGVSADNLLIATNPLAQYAPIIEQVKAGTLTLEAALAAANITDPALIATITALLGDLPAAPGTEKEEEKEEEVVVPLEITWSAIDSDVKAVVIGDSNAVGYGVDPTVTSVSGDATPGSYAADVFDGVLKGEQTAAVFAVNGATTATVLEFLSKPEVAEGLKGVKFFNLNIGGNDLLTPAMAQFSTLTAEGITALPEIINTVTAEAAATVAANMAAIIDALYAINPKATVIVNTVPYVDLVASFTYVGLDAAAAEGAAALVIGAVDAINDVIYAAVEAAPKRMNIAAYDVNYAMIGVEVPFAADGIHFTSEASEALGEALGGAFVKNARQATLKMVAGALFLGSMIG